MHSYSQDLTGNISFLASCEGGKCLPRAGSAFTVDFFHAPVPEAAGGGADDVEASEEVEAAGRGADDVEAAGRGADDLETAGGGAEVLEADACLFKT